MPLYNDPAVLWGLTNIASGMMGAGLALTCVKNAREKKAPAQLTRDMGQCAFCHRAATAYDERVSRWVCDRHSGPNTGELDECEEEEEYAPQRQPQRVVTGQPSRSRQAQGRGRAR